MAEIIRGTTPTVIYSFDMIKPEDISVCYLLIKQRGHPVIEKTLGDSSLTDGKLSFTLTQEETLSLSTAYPAQIVLDWKTTGGVRGRSNIVDCAVRQAGKDAVI